MQAQVVFVVMEQSAQVFPWPSSHVQVVGVYYNRSDAQSRVNADPSRLWLVEQQVL